MEFIWHYGAAWGVSARSVIVRMPGVVAGMAQNVLTEPGHPELPRIAHCLNHHVWWDDRLFIQPP